MSATSARTAQLRDLEDDEPLPNKREVTRTLDAPEPFVPAHEAAKFVGISRRFLIDLARRGIAGAYPIGTGRLRKTWVFRLSELAAAIGEKDDEAQPRPPASEPAYHPIIRRSLLK